MYLIIFKLCPAIMCIHMYTKCMVKLKMVSTVWWWKYLYIFIYILLSVFLLLYINVESRRDDISLSFKKIKLIKISWDLKLYIEMSKFKKKKKRKQQFPLLGRLSIIFYFSVVGKSKTLILQWLSYKKEYYALIIHCNPFGKKSLCTWTLSCRFIWVLLMTICYSSVCKNDRHRFPD